MQLFGQDLSSAKWRASIIISLMLLAAMLWMPSGMLLEIFAARARSGSRLACCLAGPGGHFQQRGFPASQSPAWNMTRGSSFPNTGFAFFPDLFHNAFPGSLLQPIQAPLDGIPAPECIDSHIFQYQIPVSAGSQSLVVSSCNQC